MLTGQLNETDVIKGLNKGASDHIEKPMRFGDLLARIRTQLHQYRASDETRFTAQNVEFQPASKTLASLKTKQVITLTEKETMILKKLFQIWPKPISKENLLSEVWGYRKVVATHTLETHIYRLRRKIFRLIEVPLVETTRDGYKLNKVSGAPDSTG